MIAVNDLIQRAFQRVGIVGDGEPVSPTQAMAGVADLQSLITELNTEDYLMEIMRHTMLMLQRKLNLQSSQIIGMKLKMKAKLIHAFQIMQLKLVIFSR